MSRTWPLSGVLLAVLWLFVRGVELAPDRILGEFLIGLAIGLPLSYAARRLYTPRLDALHYIQAAPYMLLYLAVFLRDLLVANLDVAYRVLAPSMPIEPAVVVFPLRVRKDVAITTIANSITLTPGTLTMDYDEDRHALVIHAIVGRDRDAVRAPIRQWEDYALLIFDEELKPGDPVPPIEPSPGPGSPTEEPAPTEPDGREAPVEGGDDGDD